MRPGASVQEAIDCEMAFGQPHAGFDPAIAPVSEVPDVDDMLNVAGRQGYLMWRLSPGPRRHVGRIADDATLERGGYRNPPCPVLSQDFGETNWMQRHRKVIYRFGRAGALLLSDTAH
ncbi:MAG: hypothetical protein WDN04_03870 [Rhodospirillales bacterium]